MFGNSRPQRTQFTLTLVTNGDDEEKMAPGHEGRRRMYV